MRFFALLLLVSLSTTSVAQIQVQGHRGARADRPENTLSAFRYALEVGVDVLELDVVVSKDKVLIISHDPHLNTELCHSEAVEGQPRVPLISLTLAQIQQFDCGSLPHPLFPQQLQQPGETIPSLAQLFELVGQSPLPAASTVTFNIETKISAAAPELTPGPEQFTRLLLQAISAAGLEERVVIQSFDARTLVWVKTLNPDIKTSLLTAGKVEDLLRAVTAIGAQYSSPHWTTITAATVKELQRHSIKVAPWTANSVEAWDALIDMGVDEIITDDPKALLRYLRQKRLHP